MTPRPLLLTQIRQRVTDTTEGDLMLSRSEVMELLDYIDELHEEEDDCHQHRIEMAEQLRDIATGLKTQPDHWADLPAIAERVGVMAEVSCENYTGTDDSCLSHQPAPPNACWPCQLRSALTRGLT